MPETRKQRKQQRKKSGRKNKRLSNKQIDKLAWEIVLSDKHLKIINANQHCFCPQCLMDYCIGFDGFSYYCHECIYVKFNPTACLKRNTTLTHKCSHCGGRSVE